MKILLFILCLVQVACTSKENSPSKPEQDKPSNSDYAVADLQGQEIKNGDWTFAIRGRDLLRQALYHVLSDAQRLSENDVLYNKKDINDRLTLIQKLQEFTSLV